MRLVFCLFLLLAAPLRAEEPSPEQLEALRERISELQKELDSDRRARDSLRDELRQTEKRIGELAAENRRLETRLEASRLRLARLRERQRELAEEKASQLDWLARTVRAGYMSGRQEMLKLLLNQEQPDRIARMLRYQDYFQQARGQRVKVLNRDLESLREMARKVEAARQELEQRRQAVAEQQRQLKRARSERETALANLNHSLGEDRERLASLQEDEKRLRKLLDDMSRSLRDIPSEPGGKPFAELTGELPWPVAGSRRVNFGERREAAMRWNGVVLEAASGEPVRAIHGGRVVYSDWLRGYGLLIILDHGDGFLSLYGYNQSLLRGVGEWLSTGDVLALAGNSGGRSETGLYFEIRRQGEPVNPGRWCSHRVTLPPIASKQESYP